MKQKLKIELYFNRTSSSIFLSVGKGCESGVILDVVYKKDNSKGVSLKPALGVFFSAINIARS